MQALEQSQQVLENEKTELTSKNAELIDKITRLSTEKENLTKDKTELNEKNQKLTAEKERLERENKNLVTEKNELTNKITGLSTEKDNLTKEKTDLTSKNAELNNKITGLSTDKERLTKEKDNLTKDKENLTTELSTAKSQAEKTSQKLNELERRHAPYQKLEKLYEVFLEVRGCLKFGFVATTHSAMDLIASVLSDSKYYLESLYKKAQEELSDKRSDKGEKLAELFDLLFEYVKDNKFERLKEPSAYDHSCKTLYPEQNSSQKIQRVVLRGYTYDKKIACYTIVDMGDHKWERSLKNGLASLK
ncbi:hypothetical protein KVC58_00280 [Helicobacter pylori]|nr:hypothetical protein KVC58_00280 [Helicobacter pylori]WQU24023.1 hypothetical protein KVE31_00280 [Helicobacter pylori]